MECVCSLLSLSTQVVRHLLGGRALVGRLVRPRDRRALHIPAEDDRLARRELLALSLARLRRLARRVLLAARATMFGPGDRPFLALSAVQTIYLFSCGACGTVCTFLAAAGACQESWPRSTPSLSFRSSRTACKLRRSRGSSRRRGGRHLRFAQFSPSSCGLTRILRPVARRLHVGARRVAVLRQVGVLPARLPSLRHVDLRVEVARLLADILRRCAAAAAAARVRVAAPSRVVVR